MTTPNFLALNIHAMPCTNRCAHCWTEGSVQHRRVPLEQVCFVLDELARVRRQGSETWFLLFDEPTTHPDLPAIMRHAQSRGLIPADYFLPTNGSVLAKAPAAFWQSLRDAGVRELQLTFYGLEETHDTFAGRRGAFRNLVETIRRAAEFGLHWYAGVVLHAGNVDEIGRAVDFIRALDATGTAQVGVLPFLWQGRGRDSQHRLRAADLARLPAAFRARLTNLVTEAEAIQRIRHTPDLAERPAGASLCEAVTFQVERDLRVYCGGSCDSGGLLAALPEHKQAFYLGRLDAPGRLAELWERYRRQPPPAVQRLDHVTWGDLATRYGDPDNDQVYLLFDLPAHKWAAAFLQDEITQGAPAHQ